MIGLSISVDPPQPAPERAVLLGFSQIASTLQHLHVNATLVEQVSAKSQTLSPL